MSTSVEERYAVPREGPPKVPEQKYALNEDGDVPSRINVSNSEIINFPAADPEDPNYNADTTPVLLNAKEHVVGYLSKILNARVYDAAIETELQHAKNLSAVSLKRVVVVASAEHGTSDMQLSHYIIASLSSSPSSDST
jgi:hypothetical protein